MHGPGYVIVSFLLVAMPIAAAWKRRGWPLAVYALGLVIFLSTMWKDRSGWEALADFAMLAVVVLPIYIFGSILWIVLALVDRSRSKRNKVP